MGRSRLPLLVGGIAIVLASGLAVRVLSEVDWDVTIFTAFGEEATPTREYAEDQLGEVFLRPEQGHDGKFFFVQSNDPFVLDPEENASVLDRPLYRSQRMLYPVMAGGGGVFPPAVVVWAMLIVNVIAIGVGTWAVAELATEMGGSPWWGLAFVLNLGFISEMNIGGAGIVAAAAAFGAVILFLKGRTKWAIALLLIAALTREAMLIAAAGSAWWLWKRGRRSDALASFGVPVAGVSLWAVYLRFRIGWEAGVAEVQEIGLPLVGFFDAAASWVGNPLNLTVGAAMLVLFLLFTRRVLMAHELVGWAFLGFVLLGIMFTEQVWRSYFDITRAVAPVITAFVLLVFVRNERKPTERTGVRP